MSLLAPQNENSTSVFDQFVAARKLTRFTPKAGQADDQLFDVSLGSLTDHLRRMEVRYSTQTSNPFAVSLGFLDDARPNAAANKRGDVHVAAMNTGLAMVILEFSCFCMAQASVFPEFGDVTRETSPIAKEGMPPGLSVLIQTVQTDGAGEVELTTPIIPVDPQRHAAAYYLALLMMRFVWLHEVGHGVVGHIDYLRHLKADDKAQSLGLNELNASEIATQHPSIDGRVLQCLEFEADSWALSQSMLLQINGMENIEGIAALPAELRLRMALFATYAMSWLMETMASTFSRTRLAITHPAPIRRLQMLQNMAVWELNDLGVDMPVITRSALRTFESVLGQIGAQWLQTDKFEPKRYRAIFEQTRDQLAPFRYATASDPI